MNKKQQDSWNRFFFLGLTMFFFCECIFLSTKIESVLSASLLFWPLIGLATVRLAHVLSQDEIGSWIRHPFTKIVPDSAGGMDSIEPISGRLQPIGMLLSCALCSGTWSGMFLITLFCLWQPVGWAMIFILAVAGISEQLHYISHFLEWASRNQQEQAGTQWLLKNRGGYIGSANIDLQPMDKLFRDKIKEPLQSVDKFSTLNRE